MPVFLGGSKNAPCALLAAGGLEPGASTREEGLERPGPRCIAAGPGASRVQLPSARVISFASLKSGFSGHLGDR